MESIRNPSGIRRFNCDANTEGVGDRQDSRDEMGVSLTVGDRLILLSTSALGKSLSIVYGNVQS